LSFSFGDDEDDGHSIGHTWPVYVSQLHVEEEVPGTTRAVTDFVAVDEQDHRVGNVVVVEAVVESIYFIDG